MIVSSLWHASIVAKMALAIGLVLALFVLASSAERRVVSILSFAANDTTCAGTPTNPGVYQYVTLEPGVCTRFAGTAGIRASSDFKRLDLFQQESTISTSLLCEGEPTIAMAKDVCTLFEGVVRSRFKYELLPSSGANSLGNDLCLISTENCSGPNCTSSLNVTQEFTLRHAACSAYFSLSYFKADCRERVLRTYSNATCLEADLLAQGGDGQCIDHIYGSSANSAVVDFIEIDGAGAKLTSWLSSFLSVAL